MAKNGLQELWIVFGVGKNSRFIPLHLFINQNVLTESLLSALPAIHSLTGCDTTSKISTKHSAITKAQTFALDYIKDFGKQPLSEDMEREAEFFTSHTWIRITNHE